MDQRTVCYCDISVKDVTQLFRPVMKFDPTPLIRPPF